MGRPPNLTNINLEILWLKFKQTGQCPKCDKWDVDIRLIPSVPKERPSFLKYHCNLCRQEWADPTALANTSVKRRITVK